MTAKICYKTGCAKMCWPFHLWLAGLPWHHAQVYIKAQLLPGNTTAACLPMWCYVMPLCSPRLQEFEYDFSKLSWGSGIQWHSLSVAWFPLGPNPVQIASPPQTSKPAPVSSLLGKLALANAKRSRSILQISGMHGCIHNFDGFV